MAKADQDTAPRLPLSMGDGLYLAYMADGLVANSVMVQELVGKSGSGDKGSAVDYAVRLLVEAVDRERDQR